MRKKQRNRIFAGIGILVLVVILIGLFASGTLKLPLSVAGTSTLSLTQANLQSSNPYLSGNTWLLTFRAGGLSQRYYGTFSPSQVQSLTYDKSTTTKDFSIEVDYEDQQCSYSITGTTTKKPIYDIKRKTWTCLLNPSYSTAKEKSGFSEVLYYGAYTGLECFAIGYNTKSPVGNLNSPNVESEFDIKINVGGDVASKTINTLSGTTQGNIGNFAYAIWQGNLVSGKSCPDKDPYVPIYVNGVWRLGRTDAYNTYLSLVSTSPTSSRDSQEIWMSNIQNAITNAKQSQSFGTINSITSLSNAVVKKIISDPVQFPVTTLYIKADTLGVYTPTPEIRLSSPNSECFGTGEQGAIEVTLENIGDEYGTWNLYAQCQSPFYVTSNIQVSLQKGQSVTRLIPISASASKEERSLCTIYAESPAGVKTASVNVCVKPQVTCEPNKEFCTVSGSNEVIKRCSSDGATSSIIETCSLGYYCEYAECKLGDKESGGGIFSSIGDFFKNIFSGITGFFGVLKIVVAVIVLIFATLFGADLFKELKVLKNKEWLAWLLALVVAFLIAWITFSLFWLGIIIFVVWVIFRLIVGGKLKALQTGVRSLRR